MTYDFDKIIDRRDTYSMKYNPAARGKPDDVIPLWVADMDFTAPPCVLDAIMKQTQHGIFGYFHTDESYSGTLQNWFLRRHNWHIEHDWLIKLPGVVSAIHLAIMAFTEPDESVIIQQPVYYPFMSAVSSTGRRLVVNQLALKNGRYEIDFNDFEQQIISSNVKVFVLCNPHNPVGRVFTREELMRLGDICLRHNVIVIADEIHQDFIYDGHQHLVFAGLDSRLSDITVTCTAPTKTFNIAALSVANIFISNKSLRKQFSQEYAKFGVPQIGVMEIVSCVAAYEHGEKWLSQLLHYLSENMNSIDEFLKNNLPEIELIKPEGTYLAWLDFRALGLSDKALDDTITHKAKLWLHRGTTFGAGGEGFMRLNTACPRSVLQKALEQLKRAFN
ncbi:MAG: pyridoxal phosphate-dependent aminotransferase [Oscillospiraceae bacterium]|nr:pyridoxal phosphate-dependent aminotransferase [Oscillospiraceae bacterium]MCL2278156.1 pyridoxal phosphate-dependent aminotransferase [Oscillospiraceae bacterium]